MRVRGTIATTALVASAVLLPTAFADDDVPVDEACLLVQDTMNDTRFQDTAQTSGVLVQRDIDIVSADVSTTDDVLYAVIRVQALDARPPTSYLQGLTTYRLEFGSARRRFYVQVPMGWGTLNTTRYSWPYGATAGRVGGRGYNVWSQTDLWDNEIQITAPLHVFGRNALPPGAVLTDYAVSAVRTYTDSGQLAPGVPSKVTVSDSATSKATYDAAAPSCITPEVEDQPVDEPAGEPEPTAAPSPDPTPEPTVEPTAEPTAEPTEEPTAEPTVEPTEEPTEWPTAEPTEEPTEQPSAEPTEESTEPEPSPAPSSVPDDPMFT